MGIKLSAALGHETVAISSSYRKQDLAMKKGASGFVAMSDSDSVDSYQSKLDLILDTIPAHHDINPLIKMLTTRGNESNLKVRYRSVVFTFSIASPHANPKRPIDPL